MTYDYLSRLSELTGLTGVMSTSRLSCGRSLVFVVSSWGQSYLKTNCTYVFAVQPGFPPQREELEKSRNWMSLSTRLPYIASLSSSQRGSFRVAGSILSECTYLPRDQGVSCQPPYDQAGDLAPWGIIVR